MGRAKEEQDKPQSVVFLLGRQTSVIAHHLCQPPFFRFLDKFRYCHEVVMDARIFLFISFSYHFPFSVLPLPNGYLDRYPHCTKNLVPHGGTMEEL